MIHKFNQFVNESNSGQNPLSAIEQFNKPYSEFIERAEERLDIFKQKIAELLKEMDQAIEEVNESFNNIIVGDPEIEIYRDLSEITVKFHTNIPNNDDAWETDESPAQDLEYKLNHWFGRFKNVRSEIGYKADDEGNCTIELYMYVIDSDNFGEFTDALKTFGEE